MAPARRSSVKISETSEHKTIAGYFRKVGLGGCAVALHIRNERPGDWQRMNAHKMGAMSGIPDWLIVDSGRAIFLEIKPRGWRVKKNRTGNYTAHESRQLEVHALLKRAGASVVIVETLDEAISELRHHGVPIRETDIVTEGLQKHLLNAMAEAASE